MKLKLSHWDLQAGNFAFQIMTAGFWREKRDMNGCFQPDFVNEVRRPDEVGTKR